MINKIITIVTSLIGIAAFFLGKNSEKNKQNKRRLKTYEEAKKTNKKVKELDINSLDDELNKLLND